LASQYKQTQLFSVLVAPAGAAEAVAQSVVYAVFDCRLRVVVALLSLA
jgi:hypothetical protein